MNDVIMIELTDFAWSSKQKMYSSKGKDQTSTTFCVKQLFLAGLSYNLYQYLPNSVNIVDSMISSSFE